MKSYLKPTMDCEIFSANDFITACYTLVCAIPGKDSDQIGDGVGTRYFLRNKFWDGSIVHADRLAHGNCGNESTSYDVDHSIGYEHNNDGTIKDAIITDVHIGSHKEGNQYYATWKSNNGIEYTHYGYALMSDRPNHS